MGEAQGEGKGVRERPRGEGVGDREALGEGCGRGSVCACAEPRIVSMGHKEWVQVLDLTVPRRCPPTGATWRWWEAGQGKDESAAASVGGRDGPTAHGWTDRRGLYIERGYRGYIERGYIERGYRKGLYRKGL